MAQKTAAQTNTMIADVYNGLFETQYDIVFRERLPRVSGRPIKGLIDPVTDQIKIRRDLPLAERSLTLLHEIVHECYPEWREEDVESCATYTYQRLSDQDRAIVDFLATDPVETRIGAPTFAAA